MMALAFTTVPKKLEKSLAILFRIKFMKDYQEKKDILIQELFMFLKKGLKLKE
jgi:hypothetical protein